MCQTSADMIGRNGAFALALEVFALPWRRNPRFLWCFTVVAGTAVVICCYYLLPEIYCLLSSSAAECLSKKTNWDSAISPTLTGERRWESNNVLFTLSHFSQDLCFNSLEAKPSEKLHLVS